MSLLHRHRRKNIKELSSATFFLILTNHKVYGIGYAVWEAAVARLAVATLKCNASLRPREYFLQLEKTLYVLRINSLRSLEDSGICTIYWRSIRLYRKQVRSLRLQDLLITFSNRIVYPGGPISLPCYLNGSIDCK